MPRLVPKEAIAYVWPEVSLWVASAMEYSGGDENLLDVLCALARGEYLLWHEPGRWAVVCQVQHCRRMTVWAVHYVGGERGSLREIAAFGDGLGAQWAKSQNCSRLRVAGRPSWGRVMRMNREATVFSKEI